MNHSGFILISCLIVICIITMLVISAFKTSDMQFHMSLNAYHTSQSFQAAVSGLQNALYQLHHHVAYCFMKESLSIPDIINKSQHWWHSYLLCQGKVNTYTYHYFFQKLILDPCTLLHKQAVQYFSIVIRADQPHRNSAVSILQETVAEPVSTKKICHDKKYREIKNELQSWRILL